MHLSKNQRFAEAQRWFHYIFDPTSNDTSIPSPTAVLEVPGLPQRRRRRRRSTSCWLLLSKPDDDMHASRTEALKESVLAGYEAIKNKPFQPHAVARTRQLAYQYCVVMKYLDNLIAWGDSLFRQDTIESINEATQLYVLAANILGPRPQRIPPRGPSGPRRFAQLKEQQRSRPDGQRAGGTRRQVPVQSSACRRRTGDGRRPDRSSASGARSTSAFRATKSCSATGIRWPTGSSRSATA